MQRCQSKNIEIQEFVNFTFSALQKSGVGVKVIASGWFSPKNVSNISTFFSLQKLVKIETFLQIWEFSSAVQWILFFIREINLDELVIFLFFVIFLLSGWIFNISPVLLSWDSWICSGICSNICKKVTVSVEPCPSATFCDSLFRLHNVFMDVPYASQSTNSKWKRTCLADVQPSWPNKAWSTNQYFFDRLVLNIVW